MKSKVSVKVRLPSDSVGDASPRGVISSAEFQK
jgi:hypothetical protein